ncbi:MAG: cytidylate kinase-like family protein [Treponema sp.]|jgi:cytidylate kinase|nr:cytidylate kinase-like family protein [Treponema sp.]
MAIITVSRELAALGDETAQELSKLLGCRFVDRHTLEERIKSYGIAGQKFKKYDERKPSFLASLSQDRDDYLHYLKTAMFAEAEQGSCVFIGRGANVVFQNVPGVLSIFLAASTGVRIERVKSYFHCDERRARQIIERSDHDRAGFHKYFFDIDWRESGNYHLVLNTAFFRPSVCAEMIQHVRDQVFNPEAEAQNAVRLKELILEQRVKHHIIYEREIPVHFLETSVSGGGVTIYGVANSQALIEAALAAAREAAGSAPVQSEIQFVREYSVLP